MYRVVQFYVSFLKLVPDMTYNVFGGTLNLTQSIMFALLGVFLCVIFLYNK